MKIIFKFITILMLLFISICYANNVPIFKGGIKQSAVFNQGAAAVHYCLTPTNHDVPSCLLQYYKSHGASAQAIEFMKLSHGYIQKINYQRNLAVVLANVLAGDHSQAIYIINTQGDFLDPVYLDQTLDKNLQNQFNKNKQYQALVKKNNNLFYINADLAPQVEQTKNGNLSVIFNYRIASCMACAKVASAKVAFNFYNNGKFKNIVLLAVAKYQD